MVGEVRVRLNYAEESYSTCWYDLDKIIDIFHGLETAVLVIQGEADKVVQ
jgi:hypothetical protein